MLPAAPCWLDVIASLKEIAEEIEAESLLLCICDGWKR